MSTNGHLKFQGTNRATFVGATSNIMFDTTSTSLGIGVSGTDHPSSNLYITGNAYVTSDIGVGGVLTMGTVNVVARHDLESVTATGNTTPLTVEFQNADTSLVASGNVEVAKELTVTGNTAFSSNVVMSDSKFSFDTNGTFKRLANSNGQTIKMSKYIPNASNMKIATGVYTGAAYQWVSIRVKFTRLDKHTQTVQFDYLGTSGNSTVKNPIVIGDSPGNDQDNEVVVYNNTSTSKYEIYLQIDSATTIDVEIYHKGSTIDEHYTTLTDANSGAITETGLTMVYNSGTRADFSLKDGNVVIGDDTIYTGLYNYGDTQSIFFDSGVLGGSANGTITGGTSYVPPPGVIGDLVCKFQNSTSSTEAVTNNFAPPGLTCTTGDVFTFGVWALATQTVGMEFFINPAGTGGAVVGWNVIGDGNWRFYQKSVTVASGASNTTAFFRVDNNTPGAAVYLTGASIRKNPTSGVILPYTPRYSPKSGKGTVLATRTLIAKEAAIKTLTGNVGIGTTVPEGPLHISKSAPYNGDTGPGILFTRYSNTYGGCIWNESNNNIDGLYFNAFTNSVVSNNYGGTPNMVINSNGRVGIGTNAPDFDLQVLERHGLIESGYWAKYMVGTGHEAGTTRIYFRGFGDLNNVNMYVNGLHSANDASDDRIKTDEVPVENATQTLLKLKPQTYTKDVFEFDELTSEEYSNTETLTDGYVFSPTHDRWRKRRFAGRPQKETGLIIQDIWYDAPELRHIIRLADDAEPTEERPETEDIQQDPDYDSLGWGQDASHLMYQQIIPYLIKSNQELHARIQALENAS